MPLCFRWNDGLGVKATMTDPLPSFFELGLLIVVGLKPERNSTVLFTSMGKLFHFGRQENECLRSI